MPVVGKAYYICPAQRVSGFKTFYRPLFAPEVDGNGGAWALSEQDSDTAPTEFLVVVNDRRDPSLQRNPAVHSAVGATAGSIYLGNDFAMAVSAFRALRGATRANRALDQVVGGE